MLLVAFCHVPHSVLPLVQARGTAVPLQVAANARGIQLVTDLMEEYGLGTVQAYMGFIQVLTTHTVIIIATHIVIMEAHRSNSHSPAIADITQANAEAAVREMLCKFSEAQGLPEKGTVHAEDQMDDGAGHFGLGAESLQGMGIFCRAQGLTGVACLLCRHAHQAGRDRGPLGWERCV